jgi:hypothetical protein
VRVPGGTVRCLGPLAQLVAHLHDTQGVVGSSPARPTEKLQFAGPSGAVILLETLSSHPMTPVNAPHDTLRDRETRLGNGRLQVTNDQ